MANTTETPTGRLDLLMFWILTHGSVAALIENCDKHGGPPSDALAETAYMALSIIHAQAHEVLMAKHIATAMLGDCPVSQDAVDELLLRAPEQGET